MHCPLYKVFGGSQLVQLEGPGPLHVAQEPSHTKNDSLVSAKLFDIPAAHSPFKRYFPAGQLRQLLELGAKHVAQVLSQARTNVKPRKLVINITLARIICCKIVAIITTQTTGHT